MGDRGRRVRSIVDGNYWLVVGLLVVLAAGGGYLTYETYTDPGTHLERRPGPSASYTGEFTHRATVQVANPVYRQGRTLVDRRAYFTRLTPGLNGTFTYTYGASDGGNVSTDAHLELRIRSVEAGGDGEGAIEYWSVTRRLDEAEAGSMAPGEELRLRFSRNVTELFNQTGTIDERVGGTPGEKRLSVVAVVETVGRVNGQRVNRTQEYPLRLVESDSIYRVQDPGRVVNATNATRTVEVENTVGPVRKGGAPLVLVLGLVGLAVLGGARYRGALAPSEREREYLAYRQARDEFEDWITTARLDPDGFEGQTVEVETLGGLVDVAIDSDRRVLRDATTGEYRCKVDDVVYRYDPPAEPDGFATGALGGSTPDDGRPDEWEGESATPTDETSADGSGLPGRGGDPAATEGADDGEKDG